MIFTDRGWAGRGGIEGGWAKAKFQQAAHGTRQAANVRSGAATFEIDRASMFKLASFR
jgi:hypothetical protein